MSTMVAKFGFNHIDLQVTSKKVKGKWVLEMVTAKSTYTVDTWYDYKTLSGSSRQTLTR